LKPARTKYLLVALSGFLLLLAFTVISFEPLFLTGSNFSNFFNTSKTVLVRVRTLFVDNTSAQFANLALPLPNVIVTLGTQRSVTNSTGEVDFSVPLGLQPLSASAGPNEWQILEQTVVIPPVSSVTYIVTFYHYYLSPFLLKVSPFPSAYSSSLSEVSLTYKISQQFLFSLYIGNTTFSYYTPGSTSARYDGTDLQQIPQGQTETTIVVYIRNTIIQLDTSSPVFSEVRSITFETAAS
jgi:hypothetical protein